MQLWRKTGFDEGTETRSQATMTLALGKLNEPTVPCGCTYEL
jgi:hypothetical protein